MKKTGFISTLLVALVLSLVLSACGGSADDTASVETLPPEIETLREDISVEVLGVFHLDPAEFIAGFTFDIDEGLEYVFLVYDIVNNGSKNYDIDDLTAEITMGNGNSYKQVTYLSSLGNNLRDFVDNSGYSSPISDDPETLLGKGSYRMLGIWEVNGNDFLDGGTFNFDLYCDDMVDYDDSIDFGVDSEGAVQHELQFVHETDMSDVTTIVYPDEIFKVEDNYEAYQIQHSISVRATMSQQMLKLISSAGWVATELGVAGQFFVEGEELVYSDTPDGTGIGIAGSIFSADLPLFRIETLREVDPAIAEVVEMLLESLTYIDDALGGDRSAIDATEMNVQIDLVDNYLSLLASYHP